jgi:hypothetical protein
LGSFVALLLRMTSQVIFILLIQGKRSNFK